MTIPVNAESAVGGDLHPGEPGNVVALPWEAVFAILEHELLLGRLISAARLRACEPGKMGMAAHVPYFPLFLGSATAAYAKTRSEFPAGA